SLLRRQIEHQRTQIREVRRGPVVRRSGGQRLASSTIMFPFIIEPHEARKPVRWHPAWPPDAPLWPVAALLHMRRGGVPLRIGHYLREAELPRLASAAGDLLPEGQRYFRHNIFSHDDARCPAQTRRASNDPPSPLSVASLSALQQEHEEIMCPHGSSV